MSGHRLVLATLVAALVMSAGIVALAVTAGPSSQHDAADPAALDLDALAPELAATYRYVAAHPEPFTAVRCYCGCETFLGHRSLADCFVQADGSPEPHAAGCGVCNAEAVLLRSVLDEGGTASEARSQIDRVYGSTPGTAPPPTIGDR